MSKDWLLELGLERLGMTNQGVRAFLDSILKQIPRFSIVDTATISGVDLLVAIDEGLVDKTAGSRALNLNTPFAVSIEYSFEKGRCQGCQHVESGRNVWALLDKRVLGGV